MAPVGDIIASLYREVSTRSVHPNSPENRPYLREQPKSSIPPTRVRQNGFFSRCPHLLPTLQYFLANLSRMFLSFLLLSKEAAITTTNYISLNR